MISHGLEAVSAMDVICGVCGQRNPPHRRFCSACSRYLDENSQRVPSEDEAPVPPEAYEEHQSFEPAVTAPADVMSASRPAEVAPRPSVGPSQALSTAPCPRCGTENRTQLRFCRKCGHFLADLSATSYLTSTPPEAGGWWQRLRDRWRRDGSSSARAAYRRSLPLRYRLIRWGAVALLVLAAVSIPLFLTNGGTGWLRGLF